MVSDLFLIPFLSSFWELSKCLFLPKACGRLGCSQIVVSATGGTVVTLQPFSSEKRKEILYMPCRLTIFNVPWYFMNFKPLLKIKQFDQYYIDLKNFNKYLHVWNIIFRNNAFLFSPFYSVQSLKGSRKRHNAFITWRNWIFM